MKLFIFTDVHSNLNALKAIMSTEDFKTADQRIFLGDVMFGCSRPNECTELLRNMNITCILGNNDGYIFDHLPKEAEQFFNETKFKQMEYFNKVVKKENLDFMSTWLRDLYIRIGEKTLYFTHYPWEQMDTDPILVDIPKILSFEAREAQFQGIEADYYIFGHEHKPSYFTKNDKHYYCLGTCLLPPAPYLVINIDKDNITLEEKTIDFDLNEEIDMMEKAQYPYCKRTFNKK